MNNLTTRKIVLGMLMVLILAFGVQGIADALTFGTSRSGDLQTVDEDDEFTIRFSVNLRSPQAVEPNTRRASTTDIEYADNARTRPAEPDPITSNFTVTEDSGWTSGDTHYYTVTTTQDVNRTGTGATGMVVRTTHTRNWVTESAAYHYNDESVSIASNLTVTLQKGRTDVTSLTETASESDERLTSSVTLKGEHDTAGVVNITITDTTPTTDFPSDAQPPNIRASTTFTIYVVGDAATTLASAVHLAATSGGTTPLEYQVRGNQDSRIFVVVTYGSNPPVNLPVTITVNGGGRVYVEAASDRRTSATTSLSTSSAALVYLSMNSRTNKVTASIAGLGSHTATFIYGNPRLERIGARDPKGIAGGRLAEPLGVRLVDFEGDEVSGIPVTFSGGDNDQFTYVPSKSRYKDTTSGEIRTATSTKPANPEAGANITVYTDSDGEAYAYYQFDPDPDPDEETFPVVEVKGAPAIEVPAITTFEPEIEARDLRPTLHILSGNNQRTDEDGELADPLVVVVRQDGRLKPGEQVTFRTSKGTLIGYTAASTDADDDDLIPISDRRVYGRTDGSGEAEVTYFQDPEEGSDTVTAMIRGTTSIGADYEKEVTFNVNGSGGTRRPSSSSEPSEPSNTITITLSSTTGEPGDEIDVRVTSDPSGVLVNINSGELSDSDFSRLSGGTRFTSTLILPDEEGEYTFSATRSDFTSGSATVTVEAELGELSITAIGTPDAGSQTFSISAVDADGDRASAPFTARLSGTGFTSRNVEIAGGRGNARVTLPTAARLYTLTVRADGYIDGSTPVRIAAGGQVDDTDDDTDDDPVPPPPEDTGGEPDSIEITGPSTRSGTVNEELDTPLLVRVLDDDGDGLEGARVFYRVTGRGRISDGSRGGRSVGVVTDDDGYARANFTPTDGGSSTVRVNTDDVSRIVTFTITTGSAPTPRGPGTGVPSGTSVSPVVHVAAASRPPMLWVDGGAIYALVGASPQRFAASVDNALNITVGGGKVYWTEKTGESGGTINSANLNGSDVTELTSIKAVPMGIAVDTAGSKLYWTNSRGRIQSADLDGSGITNVMQNLPSPMDLALAGGNAYWTQGNGSVRFVNLRGQKVVRNVSTGTDTPGSLVIGGGKVYWTEMTGESGGTVNSANLNGTGATQLASILAAPMGIAVDGSRSKLYWTNARGRVQSANLDGSGIKNVVSGLGSPGELVLSNSIAAPAGAGSSAGSGTTASDSKYDVNGDGVVDRFDALLVVSAFGTSNNKYDVNGDGTVNVKDYDLVFDNLAPGAAAAPAIVGVKFSAAQIDRIEEQIDLLIAMNDRSPAALRTLIYLQQLLVTARPEKTLLLANYPNPFNPETWIPYELATDTDVRLTIYNTQGVVIRSLQLGHQSAGYYTGRDRAAYWDGRNALGERVASGLYFYQLETDEMSLMRKMVILK